MVSIVGIVRETNHIKSSLIYKLSQRQRGRTDSPSERETERGIVREIHANDFHSFNHQLRRGLLSSLSRIYHNDWLRSGLPLMAFTVFKKKKKSEVPAVVFVELNPIVLYVAHIQTSSHPFRTLMTLSALAICGSALSNGCKEQKKKENQLRS